MIRLTLVWLAGACVGLFAGFVAGLRDRRLQDDVSLAHALHRAKRLRSIIAAFDRTNPWDTFPGTSDADIEEVVDYLETEHRRAVARQEGGR